MKTMSRLRDPTRRVLMWLLAFAAAFAHADPVVLTTVLHEGNAFIVTAVVDVPVSQSTAWAVLTDFDHMTQVIHNLTVSKVVQRQGNRLTVHQEGTVKWGPFAFAFEAEREFKLEPMKRITARNLSGTVKRAESETLLTVGDAGVHVTYRAEVVPDSMLGRMFGGSFARDTVEEQIKLLAAEMRRRESAAPAIERLEYTR